MFTKPELLRISRASEKLFDYSLNTGLIPRPDKIVWLNPVSQPECFPDYVLNDLLHLNYLEACGVSTLWELKKFLLGGEGTVKYEADFKRMCGDIFYGEVHSNQGEVNEKLYQKAEDCFNSQKIVSATFRAEKINGRAFLVLSRVVLKPRAGFYQVELKRTHSKDYQTRLTEAYKLITKGRFS